MRQQIVRSSEIWGVALRQHGVVSRRQLLELGLNGDAIHHRCSTGRLHRLRRGVFVVGRPEVTRAGELMAAVLACGGGAVLSHLSAAEHYGIVVRRAGPFSITIPAAKRIRQQGIHVHRRDLLPHEATTHRDIPVTAPICTMVDIASVLSVRALEAAVNAADKLDLVDPPALRLAMREMSPRAGKPKLARLLDRATFTLTDSELERRFLPLARAAGLPRPLTRHRLHGYRVDFYWPDLGLVVETDGLRYHRTASAQARDRERDQVLTAAGLTVLRFTHWQVRYDRTTVQSRLRATASRLRANRTIA